MKLFDAWKLVNILQHIEWARRDRIEFEIKHGKRDTLIPSDFRQEWLDAFLIEARELALKAELPSASSRVNEGGGLSRAVQDGLTYQELDYELRVLRESIQFDLDSKHVYIVESEKQKYNTQEFILETWGAAGFYFPGIRKDAQLAMQAYVRGLNTACVFHLMRIAEVGLRALGRRMHVRLARRRQLEWGQWNEIISEMSKKADLLANRKASNARDELLEFYRGSIGEFQGYKDAYRNFVMHMRERTDYGPNEARSLIERVSHFMDRLSSKIDEQGRVLTKARRMKMFAEVDAEIEKEKQEKAHEQAKLQGIRELRQDNARSDKGSAQRDKGGLGSGKSDEGKKETAEG